MRVVEIYVERLKSYYDYSNRRVGLRALLDEGEDLREAYLRLAGECETLLDLKEIESERELIEERRREYERRVEELRKIRDEYHEIREELVRELNKLAEEVSRVEKLVETKGLRLREAVLEKLRRIRSAIGFYDP